ncbi:MULTISPECIES: HDOD domain-containing protein [Ramlibacter]|uniref:HDOD domain-containing protein n=1 Tax=Ramlibacter aquaticus TaxID=2780094 RepID=A0ABR9SE86_9BURK|nr:MULTISPECIES: HDOD domain-containing protein [Ramlibacter]MBE7940621.1 HDOD domain-containing protein [Ramlibacter aquaticus]
MDLARLWRRLRKSPGAAAREARAATTFDTTLPWLDDSRSGPRAAMGGLPSPEVLGWMLALPGGPPAEPVRVAQLLAILDAALVREAAAGRLLRRAPNLVPRLVNALRSDAWSRREVVEQIQRDAVLTAETLRLARSALYGRQGEGGDVAQAVDLLGAEGLKQVIARVLVRPLFQADGDSLSARAAPRIWEESDRCARLGAALAREAGDDSVEACLAGLLHSVGWSALLQLRTPAGAELVLDQGLLGVPGAVQGLALRRDRILSLLLPDWGLGPLLTAWGSSMRPDAAAAPSHGLAVLTARLAQAESLVALRREMLLAGAPVAPPPGLAPAVARVWAED